MSNADFTAAGKLGKMRVGIPITSASAISNGEPGPQTAATASSNVIAMVSPL
jgi:hypothetical protein